MVGWHRVGLPLAGNFRNSSPRSFSAGALISSAWCRSRQAPDGTTQMQHESMRPDEWPLRRWDRLRETKPLSDFLTDTFERRHDYLRISVTERCNLRCLYCMPEEGVALSQPRALLTTAEIGIIAGLFVAWGVTKIRLTGGEPTLRRDIVPLMRQLGSLRAHGLRELCLTTNGVVLHRHLDSLVEAGLTGVNLSLDTLDPFAFQIMTRRRGLEAVLRTMDRILDMKAAGAGRIRLKINCVVVRGLNDEQVLPFVELTRDKDVEVRFIEYMPFDGNKWSAAKMVSYREMLDRVRARYPGLEKIQDHANDTSKTFQVAGFVGRVGFVTSMTHDFCATCNRLRITSDGKLKVCLFGNAEVSLRDAVRKINGGEPIDDVALTAMKATAMATTAPEFGQQHDPPALLVPNSQQLFDLIGTAVAQKKAKHAGIGDLAKMKNRPMILIDAASASRERQPRRRVPLAKPSLSSRPPTWTCHRRIWKKRPRHPDCDQDEGGQDEPKHGLTHLSHATGAAHMVSTAAKPPSARVAVAVCTVSFSAGSPAPGLIRANTLQKGDVLSVARVAGIMAAKKTPDLVPLCHQILLSSVEVDASLGSGDEAAVEVAARVECEGKTGVEMEALAAAAAAALAVYDMCKSVDRGIVISGLRVVRKEGGRSGTWVEGEKVPSGDGTAS